MFYFQTNALGFTPGVPGARAAGGRAGEPGGRGRVQLRAQGRAAAPHVPVDRLLGAGLGLTQILLITGARVACMV